MKALPQKFGGSCNFSSLIGVHIGVALIRQMDMLEYARSRETTVTSLSAPPF